MSVSIHNSTLCSVSFARPIMVTAPRVTPSRRIRFSSEPKRMCVIPSQKESPRLFVTQEKILRADGWSVRTMPLRLFTVENSGMFETLEHEMVGFQKFEKFFL